MVLHIFSTFFINNKDIIKTIKILREDKYSETIVTYVLRIFGNITTGSEAQMRVKQ